MAKIIAVDDEAGMREVCQLGLGRKGHQVCTACNGEEALKLMETEPFDLALVDIRMPSMDGIELLTRIKIFYPQTQVIMLTAENTVDAAVESLDIGAFDYVTKPFNLKELMGSIEKALENAERRKKEGKIYDNTFVYELTREAKVSNSKEELLNFILAKAVTALKADTGSVYMFSSDKRTLKLMSFSGGEGDRERESKWGQRIMALVAKDRQPMILSNKMIADMPNFRDLPEAFDISSSLIAPLVRNDDLLGAMCLNRLVYLTNREFTAKDLETFHMYASHAALIIALHLRNYLKNSL
jgi:DNA-binding response OmpR family regulator